MKYETYYSDGGHGGPHANFKAAYAYANAYLDGINSRFVTVEIRPRDSKEIGAFKNDNAGSFYVTR